MNPPVFPLGIGYLSSSLRREGFCVKIIDILHLQNYNIEIKDYIKNFAPNIIGISIRNIDNTCLNKYRNFISEYQKIIFNIQAAFPSIHIIIGGSAFSIFPKIFLKILRVKYGILGGNLHDAVNIFKQLMENNIDLKSPSLVFMSKKNTIQINPPSKNFFLEDFPFPDRDNFIHPIQNNIKIRHNLQSKIGCAFNCLYCSYPLIEGNKVQCRSIPNIINEIIELTEVYKIYEFDFVDSVFNFPPKHAYDICKEIIKRKISVSWSCFIHPHFISRDFLLTLKNAGCSNVEIGIDSGSIVCLKSLRKNLSKEDIIKSILICQEINLSYSVCLIFGAPNETNSTVIETLDLMNELHVTNLFALIGIRVLPKTPIQKMYFKSTNMEKQFSPLFYLSNKTDSNSIRLIFERYKKTNKNWIIIYNTSVNFYR